MSNPVWWHNFFLSLIYFKHNRIFIQIFCIKISLSDILHTVALICNKMVIKHIPCKKYLVLRWKNFEVQSAQSFKLHQSLLWDYCLNFARKLLVLLSDRGCLHYFIISSSLFIHSQLQTISSSLGSYSSVRIIISLQ